MDKKWLKISIECDPSLVGALEDYLVGILDAGVEVSVEDAIGSRVVNGYLSCHGPEIEFSEQLGKLDTHLKLLADLFLVDKPSLTKEMIDNQDWAENWKKHFHPFAIIPGLIIGPSWEPYQPRDGELLITMDPGMAFGTGHHPTTTLSVRLIQQVMKKNQESTVLDVGTGTGILAMAAALWGAKKVVGVDNDPEAVEAAWKNIQANRLDKVVGVSDADLATLAHPFSLVVANIIHDVLLELADDFVHLTEKNGHLILSGILVGEQTENIIDCFEKRGFSLVVHEQLKEWSGLLFARLSE